MLQLGPEHDQVEGGDGVDFSGLRVDCVQVSGGRSRRKELDGVSAGGAERKGKVDHSEVGISRKT